MHLTDHFMELIAYVIYFSRTAGAKQPPYEQVRADVQRLLGKSEDAFNKGFFSKEVYDQARFMICAWVDEAILASGWPHRSQWQREQLQRFYYNTTEAGEEVFDRLNMLSFEQKDVREVYYLCLALGFKGKFIHQQDEYLLDQVRTSNLKLLLGSSMGVPSLDRADLFPEAYPMTPVEVEKQKTRFKLSLFNICAIAAPLVLFGLLFLIYTFSLSGLAENYLRTVP